MLLHHRAYFGGEDAKGVEVVGNLYRDYTDYIHNQFKVQHEFVY